ncbi:hypothetical protein KIPE111705_15505 [Kibdelosporangium persicum]
MVLDGSSRSSRREQRTTVRQAAERVAQSTVRRLR